jgi:hypothetical protein
VGSIPAVRIAAINSRSAISDLLLLQWDRQRRRHPLVAEVRFAAVGCRTQYAMTLDLAEEELASLVAAERRD